MDYSRYTKNTRTNSYTVKEVSNLTGISVRTLHYYDEIGLLKPTEKSEAGYRLYDDKALEALRQVLIFRELDIPLKEINNPAASNGASSLQRCRAQTYLRCVGM